MSAPGIRATAQARVLAEMVPGAKVTLGGTNLDFEQPEDGAYTVTRWSARNILQLVWQHDIIISSMLPPHVAPFFPKKRFVVDLFSQYAMEWMEVGIQHYEGAHRRAWVERTRTVLGMQLTMADFILTCNERQRDSYVGMMISLGLVSPNVYDTDPTLRRYIDSAPHGIRAELPQPAEPLLRGIRPGFAKEDKIVIWNGGIIQWYDPATLLEALRILGRDDIKLLFLGAAYPGIKELGVGVRFQDAKAIAARNGQLDRTVFFEEGWVSHEVAKRYVQESDISVCCYFRQPRDSLQSPHPLRRPYLGGTAVHLHPRRRAGAGSRRQRLGHRRPGTGPGGPGRRPSRSSSMTTPSAPIAAPTSALPALRCNGPRP